MTRTRVYRAVLATVAVLLCAGCSVGRSGLREGWPKAESERTVLRPREQIRWPLAGTPAIDATLTQTPPVIVPVSSGVPGTAVAGIDLADVVYEIPLPVGRTRLLAVYHSRLPAQAGPVATVAAPDVVLARQYSAVLAFVGPVRAKSIQVPARTGSTDVPAAYRTVGPDAFVDPARLVAGRPGKNAPAGLAFAKTASGGARARPAKGFTASYSPKNSVTWDFNAGGYSRKVNNLSAAPPLRAANVVVLWAKGTEVTTGAELIGTGRASVFSGGHSTPGKWDTTGAGPPSLRAEDGSPIALSPGTTWFEVVPTSLNILLR
jgi:hypothetical protein